MRPTVLDNVDPQSDIAGIEIFGPVLSLMHVQTIDEAIDVVNATSYGNMACLFTTVGPQHASSATRRRRGIWDQYRRGRADGFLPVLWLEGKLLRRYACPGT